MLLFDTFNNDETNSFIGFSTVSNIELLIVSVPVLIILLFLANEINDKIKSSDTPDQKGLSLMEFLAAILVIPISKSKERLKSPLKQRQISRTNLIRNFGN